VAYAVLLRGGAGVAAGWIYTELFAPVFAWIVAWGLQSPYSGGYPMLTTALGAVTQPNLYLAVLVGAAIAMLAGAAVEGSLGGGA
jgi:hypothetical protein